MALHRPPRPAELIDALDAKPRLRFENNVWRVVRGNRDPLLGSRAGGRWDDGTFDVLYSSLERDGAIAEMQFHLLKGLPVIPSRVEYFVHEIEVNLTSVIDLSNLSVLEDLGLEIDKFGRLSYADRTEEYPTTQQIAEVAHFLEFDGALVPNARWDCSNLVIFVDMTDPKNLSIADSSGPINWTEWMDSIA